MKPKSTHRAPLALYVWRHLAAAFALLPAALAAAVAVGAMGTLATTPALASVASADCPPGSTAPECTAPDTESVVTATFHGAPETHNGKRLFAFEIRFSRTFDGLRLGPFKQALSVTGGRVVDVKRTVRGENGGVTVRVRPNTSDALTVTLAANTAGGGSLTVPGPSTPQPPPSTPPQSSPTPTPAPTPPTTPPSPPVAEAPATETPAPLTATFHGVPEEHDGKKRFSFEIHFSEEFDGLRLTALKRSLLVSGGRVIDVKRTVRGQNRKVTVRVRPSSHEPVIVALPPTLDCTAAGAICAKDGRKLTAHASMTVTSPAWGPGESLGAPYTAAALRSLNPPQTARSMMVERTDPSAATPTGFPSGTGSVVNMHNVGQIRERLGDSSAAVIDFPCSHSDMDNVCRIGGGITLAWVSGVQTGVWDSTSSIPTYGRWFTYPHDATGANDMKVHLQVRRATAKGKIVLHNFFQRGHDKDYFYDYLDFFTAAAHLQAPGTAVQPTLAVNTSATWTGGVVAIDTARQFDSSGKGNFWRRGDVIGGTATITVQRSDIPTLWASVALTNLKGSTVGTSYPDLNWNNMTINLGKFGRSIHGPGSTLPNSTISGTFRGTGAAKVGGTFEVPHFYYWQAGRYVGMVGGFVADKD